MEADGFWVLSGKLSPASTPQAKSPASNGSWLPCGSYSLAYVLVVLLWLTFTPLFAQLFVYPPTKEFAALKAEAAAAQCFNNKGELPEVNFLSCAQGDAYERFLPLYAFFALQNNRNAVAELVVPNSTHFQELHGGALDSLRRLFGHHAVCVRDYRRSQPKGTAVNTRRYLEVPEHAATYTYIGDVDILITSPVVSPERLMQMELNNLSYSNALRGSDRGIKRLTGVMLVKTASFYTPALRRAQRTISPQGNDEVFLARLVKEASLGLPPENEKMAFFYVAKTLKGNITNWPADWAARYRPLHGLHLSISRGPGSKGRGKELGIPISGWCEVLQTPRLSMYLCDDLAGSNILHSFANYSFTQHLAASPEIVNGCLDKARNVAGPRICSAVLRHNRAGEAKRGADKEQAEFMEGTKGKGKKGNI